MAQLTKEQIAEVFESIAQMLELKGENVFKIRAYTNAARALEIYTGDLTAAVGEGRLDEIAGVGKAIADKITELVATGQLAFFERLKAEFPPGIFEMFEVQGLGPKKIKALWEKLGIITIADLEKGCTDGRIADLAGFGKKTAANILLAIQARAKHAGRYRIGVIAGDAEQMVADLRELPEVLQASIAGSYRRRKEVVGDLDFIVATSEPEVVSKFFIEHPMVESVMVHGATKSSVRMKSGIQADLRVVTTGEYPFALNYFTGSKEHNIVLRQRALARGWTLNEYRLGFDEKSKITPEAVPPIDDERGLYRALDLDYVEPELREDRGEVAAAEAHTLPNLVELENLRGTFHNHTTASDGRSSLAEMAAAAQELGLQYLGIADHSKSSFQARGLEADRLLAQVAEIRALNATFDGVFRIFAGSEVDILKDGTLDFADEV
ncbi:MAG: helix-hairpin-helix domain-containing protein, partial [Verrucomicrobia bacterium]|nr:helix-hairpin-helix domain-containing protein [Verrucomicrobiota bacterium]